MDPVQSVKSVHFWEHCGATPSLMVLFSSTFIHFHRRLSVFICFYTFSSTFIHFHLLYQYSSTFMHTDGWILIIEMKNGWRWMKINKNRWTWICGHYGHHAITVISIITCQGHTSKVFIGYYCLPVKLAITLIHWRTGSLTHWHTSLLERLVMLKIAYSIVSPLNEKVFFSWNWNSWKITFQWSLKYLRT